MRQNKLFFSHQLGTDAQHQGNWQIFNYWCWVAYKHNTNRGSFNHIIILFQVVICFSWNRLDCSVLTNKPQALPVYNNQVLSFKCTACPVNVSRGFCSASFSLWDPQWWRSLSICMFIVAKAKVNNKLCLKLILDITQVTSTTNPCVHFSKRASQSKSDFSVWGNVSPPPRRKAHISAW